MDFDNTEKIIESSKKKPKKTLKTLIVFLALLAIIAYFRGYFGEKGKQHAASSKESHQTIPTNKENQSLSGTILDQNGEPLSGVIVTIMELGVKEITNDQGGFFLKVEGEKNLSVRLMAQKAGFETHRQDVTLGNVHLSFQMRRKP